MGNVHSVKYCIQHEAMVLTTGIEHPYHTVDIPAGHFDPSEYDICDGEFAECPPPEMTEDDWEWIFTQEELGE